MVPLPLPLYYFVTLPLWIPQALFRELDSLIIAFIRGTGHRRVTLMKLQRPVAGGGMAVPEFKTYYFAEQLQWLTQWLAARLAQEREMG